LAVAGILRSYMGNGGGYAVEKEPHEISMLDVIVASEGPIFINKCLEDDKNCNAGRAEICVIHKKLVNIQKQFLSLLDSVKMSDLIEDEKQFKLKNETEEQL
jgi:Rrf2 family protein